MSILGRLHLLRNETSRRVIVFAAGCDPRSVVYELLKEDGYDVFTIDNVTVFRNDLGRYEDYVAYLTAEFAGFGPWLTGRPIDGERLLAELRFKNRVLSRIQRIFELRLRNPLLIGFNEMQQIAMGGSHFYNQRDRYLALLDRIIGELGEAVEATEPGRHIPLVLSGIASLAAVRAIEESGGAIVGTVRFGSDQYREDIPPLEALARYLINIQLKGEGHDISGAPASHRRFLTEDLIRQTGARGVVSSGLVSCPFFSMAAQLDQDYFKRKGVPFIALETPGNIREGTPEEAQITRVKAFMEMFS
jgi:benzoyl-CoA reductase/2-hydroxyglutaryl-CoA dehydratase subunit BcrC/BadD/HgdB